MKIFFFSFLISAMLYKVHYQIATVDHDGYCSDTPDGKDIEPIFETRTLYVETTTAITNTTDLEFDESGCSSDCSPGYCKNYGSQYQAMAFELYNNTSESLCGPNIHAESDLITNVFQLKNN